MHQDVVLKCTIVVQQVLGLSYRMYCRYLRERGSTECYRSPVQVQYVRPVGRPYSKQSTSSTAHMQLGCRKGYGSKEAPCLLSPQRGYGNAKHLH